MILFAQSFEPWEICAAAAIALLSAVLIRRSHRYLRRAKKQNRGFLIKTDRPEHKVAGHHLDLPDEALRWEVEMEEIVRDASARIDAKTSILRALIADADRAAQRLEEATANFAQVDPATEESSELSSGTLPPTDTEREEAHTLADYGFSPADIASRLSLARSQVETILDARED